MLKPEIPENESGRLAALERYKVLDTLPEEEYDAITRIAALICGTPIALISLVDPERQWFKSHHGLDASETPRELAFCAHAINSPEDLFIIPDARKDIRFHDNPLTVGAPHVTFYAGAPLNTPDGHSLGTLCVIDHHPGELTEQQRGALKSLADQVIGQLELRLKNHQLRQQNTEIGRLNSRLEAFAYRLSHDLKTPIRGIKSVVSWINEDYEGQLEAQLKDWLDIIGSRADYMESLTNGMLDYSRQVSEEVSIEDFHLGDLLRAIQAVVANGVDFKLKLKGADREIRQFKAGFKSIFQNLISNSLKYSDKDKIITSVELSEVDEHYRIIYEDNGPGIPPEFHLKVFELFETIEKKGPDSTGIGLATVHTIIEGLGGTVILEPQSDGEGIRFVINIPVGRT